MEKQLSGFRLGLTFAGCFLGAGYVSGREIWQFFGRFGIWGWFGLIISMSFLGLFGAVTLFLVRRTGDAAIERLMIPWNFPFLRDAVSVLSILFLFGIDIIMTAGVGALFRQFMGLSAAQTGFLFSIAVALSALTGLEGMISAFSFLVPFLTICAFVIGVTALAILSPVPVSGDYNSTGWVFSAATFAAYNIFGSVAILAPLGKYADNKQIRRGVAFGVSILLLTAGLFLLVLNQNASAVAQELPMLSVAERLSPFAGWIFAFLLLLAMFGAAFSCFLTGINQIAARLKFIGLHRKAYIFLFSVLIWLASLFGFGNLMDFLYPAFGCLGAVFLLCMLFHFFLRVESRK